MFRKAKWGALLVCLAAGTALAQDPVKTEPTHYRLAFENEHVQVVYVHYGPHEKSGLHAHPGGVLVNITGGHMRLTDENGKTMEINSKAGEARWYAPFKHKVENLGDTACNAVYIGMKGAEKASLKDGELLDEHTAQELIATLLASGKR